VPGLIPFLALPNGCAGSVGGDEQIIVDRNGPLTVRPGSYFDSLRVRLGRGIDGP
jgi:hypothetical protein